MNWISVKEQPLPKDDGTYLVASDELGFVAPIIRDIINSNTGHQPGDWDWGVQITHWMPLPPPPTKGIEVVEGEHIDLDVAK